MKLTVKPIDITTGGIIIATLHDKDAQRIAAETGSRILIAAGKKSLVCVLDTTHSDSEVSTGHIGLFQEAIKQLNLRKGQLVSVSLAEKPKSVDHIRNKLKGARLSAKEIFIIVDDISNNRLTDIEKTYFVAGCYARGLSKKEIVYFTKAMIESGNRLCFDGIVLDKHNIGGIPGNRVTMLLVPILAALGFVIPKTSSRAITSPAGTADTMECLANVEISERKIQQVVTKTGGCIVHGGAVQLAPADDKIIKVEHPLLINPEGQLLASILAKKCSVSATHVLIEIPVGKHAKVSSRKQANHLKKLFLGIGKELGLKMKVLATDGTQPIGNGIGPALEAQDVMAVLRNEPYAPQDLKEKALRMACILLNMTKQYKNKDSYKLARDILESGEALRKMEQIINAQGKQKQVFPGKYSSSIKARRAGKIKALNNKSLSTIAFAAGAPADKGAGMYLHKKKGTHVKKNEPLYTIYAENRRKLQTALALIKEDSGYEIK